MTFNSFTPIDSWGVNAQTYGTFQERNISDTRFSRNFEELITEREDILSSNEPVLSFFNDIYEVIRDKLTFEENDTLTEKQISDFKQKYQTKEVSSVINTVKMNIVNLYTKKNEHQIIVEERKNLFKNFCSNINETLNCIENITKENTEDDILLKNILKDRINWYYKELNLDTLIKEENDIQTEFSFLKKTCAELSSILAVGTCSVCLERQVSWYVDPCGHTLCETCKIQTESASNCHYCRTKKTKYNRLYL
jgi:hypothetical protein